MNMETIHDDENPLITALNLGFGLVHQELNKDLAGYFIRGNDIPPTIVINSTANNKNEICCILAERAQSCAGTFLALHISDM